MKILLACFTLIFWAASLVFTLSVGAQESTAGAKVGATQAEETAAKLVPVRFLPDHPLYFLITAKETVTRFLKPSAAQRFEFDFVLSGKRLKETHMLITEGMFGDARKNLGRYQERLDKMTYQLEKARSQNQDISKQIGAVSDSFKNHEIMLAYFMDKGASLSPELDSAINGFLSAVWAVDKINPGIKDRYRLLNKSPLPEPSPLESGQINLFESSPSAKPKRIIY